MTLPHTPGVGDVNPGPHVWAAVTLPTEATLQPCAFLVVVVVAASCAVVSAGLNLTILLP